MYKVYRKGNYLQVIDLDNNQIWNASVDRAFIEKMFDSRDRYNFYFDYPIGANNRFLDGIFLEFLVDENDVAWTLEDFEHFRTCKLGYYPVKPACGETFLGDGLSAYEIALGNGFTGTEAEWLDSLNGTNGTDLERDYLKYTALISHSNEDNPTTIVLGDNTIGNIVWTRTGAGIYSGTLLGAFPADKTWLNIQLMNGSSIGSVYEVTMVRVNNNAVRIITSDGVDTFDEVLNSTSIEIRVYP